MQITCFKELDDLIHKGIKEIVLGSDIILSDAEEDEYLWGIKLDADDMVIDGNGHSIDARHKTRIFNVTGKNILIKNATFMNGHAEGYEIYGGFMYNEGEVSLEKCKIINNYGSNAGAIYNNGHIHIAYCEFDNNSANLKIITRVVSISFRLMVKIFQ